MYAISCAGAGTASPVIPHLKTAIPCALKLRRVWKTAKLPKCIVCRKVYMGMDQQNLSLCQLKNLTMV